MSAWIKSSELPGSAQRFPRAARVAFGLRPKGAVDLQTWDQTWMRAEILFHRSVEK
jgi:hypothetical protein